ncbi:TetR family transcriptional regulator [Enterococcus thailandicus]|uniref:TetR family transcriptional regulator n=1 Tax=Enterococcus TaxID=1350 RepID=UPI0022E348CC|nr:TetR family transcriptional regulator [Enterococcus thailandicus]MDK4353215.1 TetR family transcriptional regulator [Enterococcus thailandicus]MDT2735239.1 TetR family transcriptional regulator [Enterococcus thailandicus]GMC02724.1 TetR family transcriptional regulator [Enterococcus thailandicus]GMC10319.1 TetR family transcriptional regulator [Enterococcus thailandicus]
MEPKLSQKIIIQNAFAILAEKKEFSALSMRNLAKKLDVQAPALYWYFKNKQQLLQKMAETIEETLVVPNETLPWKQQLLQFMENYYDLYSQFPCAAEIEIHTVPAFPSRLEHLETMIQLLIKQNFSLQQSHQAISALHNLLIGQLMDYQQEQKLRHEVMNGNELLKESVIYMRTYVQEHQLTGLIEDIRAHRTSDNKQEFLNNVAIYLAGLEYSKTLQ